MDSRLDRLLFFCVVKLLVWLFLDRAIFRPNRRKLKLNRDFLAGCSEGGAVVVESVVGGVGLLSDGIKVAMCHLSRVVFIDMLA
ncbi:hypothetical protein [Endozoicomonas sp. GU-1]|uniref:hypothetical protein n=1 Tax=Endozoicomonas sp. GU-1 TaxID=3009078 RepID=UPI0022B54112|nr:hypothetical protein [Endozoicomonas sp. GU-1]WBA83916.1 hypothetical protein O2T12_12725 [Endozoicomonas sp. GU-1]WBA86896.1 hypothetical protein O3276_02300 [Endozoicomonas sp. GU-1]